MKSAGITTDFLKPYIAENVKKVLLQNGLEIKDEQSRLINDSMVDWADKIIIVADNVDVSKFPIEKTEVWKVRDTTEEDFESIIKIVDEIEERIKALLRRI